MKRMLVLAMAACLTTGFTAQAADVESGLQVGDFPGAFNVKDVTGPNSGNKLCYRCQYGARPVVSIFARKYDQKVADLVKQIDGVVGKNKDQKMAAFVVVLTDDPDAQEPKLQKAAKRDKLQHTPLTVFDGEAGPPEYKVSENADLTVMMWVDSDVKVNHALTKDKLTEDSIKKIVADTKKILEN